MTVQDEPRHRLLATVDVRELHSIRWGPIAQLFPSFVEEIELGRYLKRLLVRNDNSAVTIEPHRTQDGLPSSHVFDVYGLEATEPSA